MVSTPPVAAEVGMGYDLNSAAGQSPAPSCSERFPWIGLGRHIAALKKAGCRIMSTNVLLRLGWLDQAELLGYFVAAAVDNIGFADRLALTQGFGELFEKKLVHVAGHLFSR